MKVLVCQNCGNITRPRNTTNKCSKCGGKLEPYREEKKEPISLETVFDVKEAGNSSIKIKEKIL